MTTSNGYYCCWRCGSKDIPQHDLPCDRCKKIIYDEHDRLVKANGGRLLHLPHYTPNDEFDRVAGKDHFATKGFTVSNRHHRRSKRTNNVDTRSRSRAHDKRNAMATKHKKRSRTFNIEVPDFVAWWRGKPSEVGMDAGLA
jgi:hypothetical protein